MAYSFGSRNTIYAGVINIKWGSNGQIMRKDTGSWNALAINEGLSQARTVYLKPTHKDMKTGRVLETQCIELWPVAEAFQGAKKGSLFTYSLRS